MHTKNQAVQGRKVTTVILLLLGVCFSALGAGITPTARAQEALTGTPTPPVSPANSNKHATPMGTIASSEPILSQVIIKFTPKASENEKKAFVQARSGKIVKRIDALNILVIQVPNNGQNNANPNSPIVESMESDYYISALDDMIPNDPRYAEQWALPAIGAPSAWGQMPADAPKVTVAVIDSGICADHPDLAGRIVDGWDFLESDALPQDDFGHGCAVSGVIAANMNDGVGIAGVAPDAQIMPLRVLNAQGVGSYSDVAAAIVYAADNGAQVINLSLGGTNPSATLENAVNYAISKGAIVVAAAGNNGTEGALYPAAYPDVIAVGSVDPNLQHSSFSNYGSQIDIWAPGRDILTTKRDGSYGLVSGTSFAAPHISGAEAVSLYSGKTINLDGLVINLNEQGIVSSVTPTPLVEMTSTLNTDAQLIVQFNRIVNLPLALHQPLYDFLRTIKLSNTNLTVSAYRNEGEWSEIVVVPTYIVDEHWEVQLQQDNIVRIITDNSSGAWKMYLENQETIPVLANIVPQSFKDYSPTVENLADTDEYLFPWTSGQRWFLTNGWHSGWVIYPNALDFAPDYSDPSATSSVLAAITGRLELICGAPPSLTSDSSQVRLAIYNNTTITAVYLHIAANSIEQSLLGQLVRRGRLIGSLYGTPGVSFDTPCGNGTGQHLHFEVPNRTLKINGIDNIDRVGTAAPYTQFVSSNTKLDSTGIVVCQQRYFLGNCEKFVLTDPDLTNNFVGNDKIRSIFVPAHWGIKLWQNTIPGNNGACLEVPAISLDSGIEDLGNFVWTDCGYGGAIGSKVVDTNGNSTVSAIEVTMGPNNACIASVEATCGGPSPTAVPTQPTATLPPPSDGIQIVSVSSHVVKPGEQFNPSITIRVTSGSLIASRGDHLHAIPEDSSNTFGAYPVQAVKSNVPIGGTYTFDINNDSSFHMTAPTTPGQYQSVWQMRVGGVHIGPQAVINITVKSDPITTPLPTPTIDCNNPPEGITLYEFTDFHGRCVNFTSDVMYLGNTLIGDNVASSMRVVGNWGVTLFQDPDWNGTWQEFSSDDNNLSDNQIGDNTVSSLRVWKPGDPCATLPQGVTLYRGRDFTGISQSFTKDAQFLGNETIGDNTVNAIRICGPYRVTLYRDPDWTGVSEEFTGSDSNLTDDAINNPNATVSSLRIVDVNDACNSLPSGVTLYSEANFGGRSQTFSSDVMFLGNTSFGDNAAKSVRVCGHWTVTVFRDPDWNGIWENFTGTDINLSDNPTGINNASSLRMVDSYDYCRTLGPGVTLYRGRDFTGIAQTFPGDASFLGNETIGNDTVTSIRQCGYNSRLYRDPDWQGFSEEFTGREESNLTDNQINTTSSSIRVWTVPPTPTPTVTPSPTPIPAKPDLVPYDGNGWAFPLIPSSISGDHWVGTLYAGQVTYLDWGIFNNSNVNVISPFKVKLFLDETQINEFSYTSLDADSYHGIDDWNIYVDTPGYHNLKIFVDSNNEITESNENNNSWEGSFYWNPIPVNKYTLTVSKTGIGSGTVTSNPVGIDCGSDCSEAYNYNTIVTLTATSDISSTFTGWSGGGCFGTDTCTVTMSSAQSVTATFDSLIFPRLTVSKSGIGSGTVMSSPAGIDCGSDCSETYAYITQVTLTATPATGSAFYGWSDACAGAGSCVVTMTGAKSVTATFSKPGDANGDGKVDGIDYIIWSNHYGQPTSNGPSDGDFNNDGTVDGGDYVIWANNTTVTYTLSVSRVGTGTGTVTSNPAGINCGTDCTESYAYNTQVTLTTTAATGSTFTGWSGGGCSGTNTCKVTMNLAQSVTANLVLDPPGEFNKFSPVNNATNQPINLTLSWGASPGVTSYEYCYDTTNNNTCTTWVNNGVSNTKALSGLIRGTTYYWHVRAKNAGGVTYSAGSATAFWSFTIASLPSVPVLISPVANTVTLDNTPSFTWNSAVNGVIYEIQIDDSATFTAPIIQSHTGAPGELSYTATPLSDKIYYWRVRAFNINNEPGAWSAGQKITIDTLPPLLPVHKAPANNSFVRGTPTFSWLASAAAVKYKFEYASNSNCSSPIYTSAELTTVTHTPPAMALGTFYWCVQARDLAGNWSGWSLSRTITILPLIPAAPVLVAPVNGFITNDTTPTFTWNGVTSGDTYEIQVDHTATFIAPLVQSNHGTSGQLTYTAITLPDKTYYWRVRAYNVHNEPGAWSVARRIVIDTVSPLPPALKAPVNVASVRGTPTYSWLAAATGYRYQFEYDENNDFSSPIYTSPELTTLTHKPPTQVLGTFYWHVRVRDLAGNWSGWSSPRPIIILPLIPVAPGLVSPNTGFPTNDTTPTFTWKFVPDGNIYEIQIDDAPIFAAPIVQTHLGIPGELTYTATTLPAKTYYWRVRAYNVHNEVGAWSAVRSILIDLIPPLSPALKSPALGAVVRGTPSYVWLASSTASRYQFEYDDNSNFSSPTYTSSELTTISHKPPTQAVGTFYWHVRTRDAAGNWSGWSISRAITILPAIPVAPVLISPINASVTNDNTPTLSWNSVLYGNTYQIQIATNSTFTQNAQTMTTGVGALSFTLSPLTNGKYYWRIRAINVNSELGTWSTYRYFTVSAP